MYWMAPAGRARAAARGARQRLAAQLDVALDLEGVQAGDAARQGGLAAARLADQRQAAVLAA